MALLLSMQNCKDKIFVIGTTDQPWKIAETVRRHFSNRIYVAMPNDEARSNILREHSAKFKHDITDEDWQALGQESIGFTG